MQRDDVIRVLGPIDLLTPDGSTSVGGRHPRALLGALVVSAGRSVTSDQLRRVLWGDAPPASAQSSLQTHVSRLRQLIGHDAVRRVDHSYRLDVRREQVDALRFEDLLVDATNLRSDPERCSAMCREALSLWRGPPFGDLADDEAFQLEAMRLDELRITAMELFLEAEVALGHHEIVVAELESAVQEHPYRERLWHLLIEALHRDGRRVDALRACHRLRTVLAEIGIGPGPELATLEEMILNERHVAAA